MGLLVSALWICLTSAGIAVAQEKFNFDPIHVAAKLLTSPVEAERVKGQRQLDERGSEYREILLRGIQKGDPYQQALAAWYLRILVSPWARGIEGTKIHRERSLFKPERPVERPTAHPWAVSIRPAALQALRELLKSRASEDVGSLKASDALIMLIVEVGTLETADQLAGILAWEQDPWACNQIMNGMRMIHGLPWTRDYELRILDYATPEQLDEARRNAAGRLQTAKKELLAWHLKYFGEKEEKRLEAAASAWSRWMQSPDFRFNYDPPDEMDTWLTFEPAIRLGKSFVPYLRKEQRGAENLTLQATYEIIAAAITGKEDRSLVQRLFSAGQEESNLALKIIIAAVSQEWKEELDRLQGSSWGASRALAICFGKKALPLLKKALASELAKPQPSDDNVTGLEVLIRDIELWRE